MEALSDGLVCIVIALLIIFEDTARPEFASVPDADTWKLTLPVAVAEYVHVYSCTEFPLMVAAAGRGPETTETAPVPEGVITGAVPFAAAWPLLVTRKRTVKTWFMLTLLGA